MENNNCNGSGPHTPGECRVMPLGTEPMHGNDVLCRACWSRALAYRRERNRTLGQFAQFDLLAWEDAKVYGADDVQTGFNVIRTWSNFDAIREEIVSPEPFPTREAALDDAIARRKDCERKYRVCGSAFIVRAVSEGIRAYYEFPRVNR